jgi:hypothetical protein
MISVADQGISRKIASGSRLRTPATASARSRSSVVRRSCAEADAAIGVRKRQPTILAPSVHGT